ncbi:Uncharacterised protein [Chromobacterium violaceum]|uniref:Uncharacterized protein n=1 Tax=Chromobacterium violaceum TaxID=536 RepID=A0A447TJD9_CHRVL|nr:Uncharacterised protein [Chromobacterium violaceum]
MRSSPTKLRSTSANSCSACWVGRSRPWPRSNSAMPSNCSQRASSRLTVGWDVCSKRAAPLTLPQVITARNTSIWRKLMDMDLTVLSNQSIS